MDKALCKVVLSDAGIPTAAGTVVIIRPGFAEVSIGSVLVLYSGAGGTEDGLVVRWSAEGTPVEQWTLPGIVDRQKIQRDHVEHGMGHLAGNRPLPDQLKQPVLIVGELVANCIRELEGMTGRADRFVCLLGILDFRFCV